MKNTILMSVWQKKGVLKDWIAFVKSGFKFDHFTKRLYRHLRLWCGLDMPYDQQEFYRTYFSEPETVIALVRQFDRDFGFVAVESRNTLWMEDNDYNDINAAMCEVIEEHKEQLYERYNALIRERDVAHARMLLGKHGIELPMAA